MVTGFNNILREVNQMITSTDRIMIVAMNSLLAVQKKRIFEDGKATAGGAIGTYSTTPASISRKRQAKQTGKTYFKGGYREYKSLSGKGTKVNLRDTDQMMMDMGTSIVGKNEYGIGFTNQFNYDKSQWNEEHFDKDIFISSDKEDELVVKVIDFELNKIQ